MADSELDKAALAHSLLNTDGSVSSPKCCGQPMEDNGGCSSGCCDDFICKVCGRKQRVEWGD